jgi:hypothetical protein
MRMLPEEFINVIYCFEISINDGTILFLTSYDKPIASNSIVFSPYSGLTIKEAEFNDSAQNNIILEGIFEHSGVTEQMDLHESEIKISTYLSGVFYPFVTYKTKLYVKNDMSFIIYLGSETIKYNQSLTKIFSKTCRANFGDLLCKIDKNNYSTIYEISSIIGRKLSLVDCDKENGYFTGGSASFKTDHGKQFESKITRHFEKNIELNIIVPAIFADNCKSVTLTVGCDKKFISCCNKFNNGVNFRGEPLIPDYNFLKINN